MQTIGLASIKNNRDLVLSKAGECNNYGWVIGVLIIVFIPMRIIQLLLLTVIAFMEDMIMQNLIPH